MGTCLRKSLYITALVALAGLPAAAEVTFVEVTDQVGLGGIPNGQVAWGDYDSDGDEDLLVGCRQLYRNNGAPDYTFSDVTTEAGLGDTSVSRGVWGDYDNDGFLDIHCPGPSSESNQDPNRARLWHNNGDGTFTEEADLDDDGNNDHVSDQYNSTANAWGDGNGDGFLDLYVGNYEWVCDGNDCGRCYPDFYWENNADGTFTDRSEAAGIRAAENQPGQEGPGLCVRGINWGDYDNDGDLDIFVSMYRLDPNFLLENDGTGGFTDVAQARNADGDEDSGSWGHVLGSAWGDQDNDGDLDLYTANLAHNWGTCGFGHDVSQALENLGPGNSYDFADRRLPETAPQNGMWGWDCLFSGHDFNETCPAWGDYDNDGDLDIYVTQINNGNPIAPYSSHLYGNDNDGTVTDATAAHGTDLGLYNNTTAAWCDWDNDGDLDLMTRGADVADGSVSMRLYRNDGGNDNDWLVVRVRGQATTPGTGTNAAGIGVRVTVSSGTTSMIREVEGGHGYHSTQNSLPLEFGLGPPGALSSVDSVDSVDVRWTTGVVDSYSDVPRNVRAMVFESGVTLRRGTDPAADPLPVLDSTAKLFPYDDPVLHDGIDYYYRLDDPGATILVDKDTAGGNVRIQIR